MKNILIRVTSGALLSALTLSPAVAFADGNPAGVTYSPPVTFVSTPVVLTAQQQAILSSLSQILGSMTTIIGQMVTVRTQETAVFSQMALQLNSIIVQLGPGQPAPTQSMIASWSATLSQMSAQLTNIITRRNNENAVISQLTPVLSQLAAYLATWR